MENETLYRQWVKAYAAIAAASGGKPGIKETATMKVAFYMGAMAVSDVVVEGKSDAPEKIAAWGKEMDEFLAKMEKMFDNTITSRRF